MFSALEEDKALTSWPFVSEFTHITALKTFYCFGPTGFLEGGAYPPRAEPVYPFSGLSEVHSGFGEIPNSWCSGSQIKRPYCVSHPQHPAAVDQFGRSHWRALYLIDSYTISNRVVTSTECSKYVCSTRDHEAAGLNVLKGRVKGK